MMKAVLHVHVPNNRISKEMKQKWAELTGEMDIFIIIFGDFNTSLP